jgi:CDP-diglyceride synthetase
MSKKKTWASFVGGGAFALVIALVTGFNCTTWQFWAILLASFLTRLSDLFD